MKKLLIGLLFLFTSSLFAATTIQMNVTFLIEGQQVINTKVIEGKTIVEGVYCGVKSDLDSSAPVLDFREKLIPHSGKLYNDEVFFCVE